MFFASMVPRTKLSDWHQQVNVVGSYKILSHANDGLAQRHLSMVVRRLLGHISSQLGHLDFFLQVPFEAGIQNLSLSWF